MVAFVLRNLEWITLGFMVWMTVTDAVRDAWIHEGWWKRHLAKWAHFYPPFFYLFFLLWATGHAGTEWGGWWKWLPAPVASWVIWKLALQYIGGRRWESWLTRLFNRIEKEGMNKEE